MADFRTDPSTGARFGLQADPAARKDASQENFPVASRLIAARHRAHVMAFYAFVRLADDIADDPLLDPESKLAQLDMLERALVSGIAGQAWLTPALKLKASLTSSGVTSLHARQMLQAFRRDAQGGRCKGWSDLLLYCRYSANPVGRHLLDLHREGTAAAPASDALCTALQILNHIQDCRADWVDLGRCYLPTSWFHEAGGDPEQLVELHATPAVRMVIDRTLDHVDLLLRRAAQLPGQVRDTGLRLESAVIVALARRLAANLRKRDPLAERVELGFGDRLSAVLGGLLSGVTARPRPEAANQGTRSSFYWPMRLLPKPKREAMFAIYAFCREVDDIADEPGPLAERTAALAAWRRGLDAVYSGLPPVGPQPALVPALAEAVRRHGLPRAEFERILDGMATDLKGPVRAPDTPMLELYCRQVAGAVGVLSVRVFGMDDGRADGFALATGEALQLTNILRDLHEDAKLGRCYLPREALTAAGIDPADAERNPQSVLDHPALPLACELVAQKAEQRFSEARLALGGLDARTLWPAVAMMAIYRRLLQRLRARGWQRLQERPRLGRVERFGLALRCALGRPPAR